MPWRRDLIIYMVSILIVSGVRILNGERVLPHLAPLQNRFVLDVGCGSGYHMWRMVGRKAKMVVGIDPTELFLSSV